MIKRFILIVALAIMLCGCEISNIGNGKNKQEEIIVQQEESVTQEDVIVQKKKSATTTVEETILLEKSNIVEETADHLVYDESIDHKNTLFYAYTTLTKQEQIIYREMLSILQQLGVDVEISTLDEERIDVVFQCVMQDHPEIFYVDGYTFKLYTEGEDLKRITFSGIYVYNAEEIKNRQLIIENQIATISQGIDANASDYEKVKYVYEYIINHTTYQLESMDNQNICSVFITHKSVCQGYAKATQYLLNHLGVEAVLVTGSVKNGQGHAWNLVKMDGAYYYVDTTWGDASYTIIDSCNMEMEGQPDINYDYLGVTTQELLKTHTIDDKVLMPVCDATENNYYVKEGIYFTSLDLDKIDSVFANARERSQEIVVLKCANQQVYEEMMIYLLDEQKIFEYLDINQGSIAYANSDEQHCLSFWM